MSDHTDDTLDNEEPVKKIMNLDHTSYQPPRKELGMRWVILAITTLVMVRIFPGLRRIHEWRIYVFYEIFDSFFSCFVEFALVGWLVFCLIYCVVDGICRFRITIRLIYQLVYISKWGIILRWKRMSLNCILIGFILSILFVSDLLCVINFVRFAGSLCIVRDLVVCAQL